MAVRIRKGDLVQVIAGSDRGKQGRVLVVDPARGVRVEGRRMQKHHLKPGRKGNRAGGIVEQEGFIHASNVMLVEPASGKPSRVRIQVEGKERNRVFVKSGAAVPQPVSR